MSPLDADGDHYVELPSISALEREVERLATELEKVRAIVAEVATTEGTYCNYSDGENEECATCGRIIDGSLYFRSWQEELGHAEGCPIRLAKEYIANQPLETE